MTEIEQREEEEKEEELEEEGENQRDGTMRGKEKVIEVQEIPEKLNCLLYIQRNKTFLYSVCMWSGNSYFSLLIFAKKN